MPVYEFQCRECAHHYDDLVSFDESTQAQSCPDCSSTEVTRLYSPFRAKVSSGSTTVQVDGCLPGPASQARRAGGCCGGSCGGCG